MSFASAEYLPFLALVLALFQFVPRRGRSLFLCLASFGFYSWWSLPHLALLILSTLVDYGAALALGRAAAPARRRALLGFSLVANLGILVTFKYLDFLVESLAPLLGQAGLPVPATLQWVLPLGISFYTFQSLGYTIDVYRGRLEPCRSLVDFATYVSFFPQLVAGPIERAGHLLPQLRRLELLTLPNLSGGLRLILWGLLKKRVVVDGFLAAELLPRFSSPQGQPFPTLCLVAIGMYALLYLDFSAYTDLARGSARFFGVDLVRNFDAPFLGTSVTDFARRWHMSLFHWIGDHVHAPLMRGRLEHARLWRANLVTMGLFGLWHGASWGFLVWGLASGAAISIEHSLRLRRFRRGIPPPAPTVGRALGGWVWAMSVSAVMIVFFFAHDLGSALAYWGEAAALRLPADARQWRELGSLAGVLVSLLFVHAAAARIDLAHVWVRIGSLGRVCWLVLLVWCILRWFEPLNRPFVYFQF